MLIESILYWLEATRLAEFVTLSQYGFALVVGLHLLGLGFSVGLLMWMDLRLLGKVMADISPADLYRRLAPWMLSGFAVMFTTGGALFVAYATTAYGNFWFRLKLVAMLLAAVNAVGYHLATERRVQRWVTGEPLPFAAKAAGFISLSVWAAVIFAGRMMSYTMF